MRATLLLTLTLATLVSSAQSTSPDTLTTAPSQTAEVVVKELSPTQLSAMLETDTLFIYDCNEPDMFAEAHVPGAKLIVYDEVTAESLPADRTATLVFYCYSQECPAGTTAARTAMSFGYTDVYSMIAGITGWQDAGLPTEP